MSELSHCALVELSYLFTLKLLPPEGHLLIFHEHNPRS
jgi:hypothetical protein